MTAGRVRRPGVGPALGSHERRIRDLERNKGGPWIYVGTYPGDPLTIPDSPPFQNSWANVGAPYAPLSFRMLPGGEVAIRGAVTGGTIASVVFTLPAEFRPEQNERFACSTGSGLATAHWEIGTNGTVTLVGTSP